MYDGQCFQNYSWDDDHGPPTEENKAAVQQAFENLYQLIKEEGPFDGVLGFSQGASGLSIFLIHQSPPPPQSSLFRFAILFSTSGIPEWDTEEEEELGMIEIPTLHVCGDGDTEWFADSVSVVDRCDGGSLDSAELIVHKGGHAIPKDRPTVDLIIKGIERFLKRATLI